MERVATAAKMMQLLVLHCAMVTPPIASAMAAPVPLVLYEGSGFVVANKRRDVLSHDGDASIVAELAAAGYPDLHPCHRLDAETSGVMLLATRERAGTLSACLALPDTKKLYRGAVKGALRRARGTWAQSLSNKAEGRKSPRGITAKRVAAATEFSVVATDGYVSLVDFTLTETGRTHQIRKHAAANGHPILGDRRYGEAWSINQGLKRYSYAGMALHAAALTITIDGELHRFEAPLPATWNPLLAALDGGTADTAAAGAERPSSDVLSSDGMLSNGVPADKRAPAAGPRSASGTRLSGRCAKWNVRKGFGFIAPDGASSDGSPMEDIYVHQRAIIAEGFRSLQVGEPVEFERSVMADGKPHAVRVTGPAGADVVGQAAPRAPRTPRTSRTPRTKGGSAKKASSAIPSKPLPPGAYPARASGPAMRAGATTGTSSTDRHHSL